MNQFSCCDGNTTPEGGNMMQSPANGWCQFCLHRAASSWTPYQMLRMCHCFSVFFFYTELWHDSFASYCLVEFLPKCEMQCWPAINNARISRCFTVLQSTWSCNIARLVYKWCKEPNKIASFSEIIVNPRLHCTSLPCFASPHFLLPLLLDHLRFASKCMVRSLDI